MSSGPLDHSSIPDTPSTSSGPLLPDQVFKSPEDDLSRPLSPTMFTNGKNPVKISAKHLKDHPLHEPTGTSQVLTFYPTLEEFKNFNRYIRKIEAAGAHLKAGIAKIVAPEGWTPRPTKQDFSDCENYEIVEPVAEEILPMEKPGAYIKQNKKHKNKMTGREFRDMANSPNYKNPKPNLKEKDLEDHYFANITKGKPIYGADTEGSFYEKEVHEFNMNHLGTILSDTVDIIKGVTTVYLYFGMYKTTFPWHAEDMDLYSINFLHFGAPKYWFAISSEHADRFERYMHQVFSPEAPKELCKAFLRHKLFIVTPELLRAAKIPYATMIQRPNEFIITFPRGYHMGFNTGYNLAESTNFATQRWVDYGKDAVQCHCRPDSVHINMTPFMQKYRADEYSTWFSYWYGDGRDPWVAKTKKEIMGKRRASVKPRGVGDEKRAKLGESADESYSVIPDSSSSSDCEISLFLRTHPGYTIEKKVDEKPRKGEKRRKVEKQPNHEELMRTFKKDTKPLRCDGVDFFAEHKYNKELSDKWPHCAVCQYFQPIHMTAVSENVPPSSTRLTTPWSFSKKDTKRDDFKPEKDRLLTCSNCLVVVHSGCCSGEDPVGAWKCPRCRDHNDVDIRSAACQLCELRGGALIPCQIGEESTWAHVICALFNRRTTFDRPYGPTKCFVEPSIRQYSETSRMPELSEEYRVEHGELYEDSRWECYICHKICGGLIPCVACIEEASLQKMPTVVHITCARRVGYVCETRDYPRGAVVICHRHDKSYLEDKNGPTFTNVKLGDEVFVENEESKKSFAKGVVVMVDKKDTIVVDFLDSSCSRDNTEKDIVSCDCLRCENGDHQYGARVKVLWEDKQVYDAYYRGKGHIKEYTIRLEDGRELKNPRNKLMTKRELNAWIRKNQ